MAKRRPAAERKGVASGRHELRRRFELLCVLSVAAVLVWRAFDLAVVDHRLWVQRAEAQHGDTVSVPAARGTIYDRDQVPLAASREVYRVAVAPREVKDTALVLKRLRNDLGLTAREAKGIIAGRRRWVPLRGRFEESTREKLNGIHGLHFEPVMQRFYPQGELAAELLGRVNISGEVGGGLEQELDSVLAGRDGVAVKRINSRGQAIAGAMVRIAEPVPGRDVQLTIDVDLQEIATDALRDALETTHAAAGEMAIVDPHTGEILAAVSRQQAQRSATWAAATSPYEPGSTIKPFTVATLLAAGRATLQDSIYGEQGSYRLYGRTITDVHPHGWLTLHDAFLVSSNIVMAKVASRLDPAEQYQKLRDFGFGSPTGIGYPSESGGTLHRPYEWSKQSSASLAFGYEIGVTPLQLLMAYAAIANGGLLMEPLLVREVRARDGRVFRAATPRVVRRVIDAAVAAQVRGMLAEVVETGTGQAASLGDWKVAGKTGTTRFSSGGHYIAGAYIATFAGFFPAEDPQIVFLVKLERPQGDYYAGLTAAPVTRTTLQAALAAKGTPLDRRAVAIAGESGSGMDHVLSGSAAEEGNRDEVRTVALAGREPVVLRPVNAVLRDSRPRAGESTVPDVKGAALRDAVRVLHAAGFRVRVEGSGRITESTPAAGSAVRVGSTVTLRARGGP